MKKNIKRLLLLTLFLCIAGYFVGRCMGLLPSSVMGHFHSPPVQAGDRILCGSFLSDRAISQALFEPQEACDDDNDLIITIELIRDRWAMATSGSWINLKQCQPLIICLEDSTE